MIEIVKLDAVDTEQMLPSGVQPIYKNRIGWAHDRLKRAGYSESPKRGYWKLTSAGHDFALRNPNLSERQLDDLAAAAAGSHAAHASSLNTVRAAQDVDTVQSPQDQVENGLADINASVAQGLLERINRNSPAFFERLVLLLLFEMGYGTNLQDLKQVGGSGDGGIDGEISLDKLGLQKVYVQAKRWQGQVGSPEIQGFIGALHLRGSDRGVLITSGSISTPATKAAAQARGNVVLIDGQRLATLMIENGVGVSHQVVKIPKVDEDFFDDQ